MALYVDCGVAYDSDLEHIGQVTLEVGRAIQHEAEGADRQYDSSLRWEEFSNSAVTFTAVLRVTEFQAQYAVTSAFMKALHRRFREEGIEIPYPMRTMTLKSGPPVPAASDRFSATYRNSGKRESGLQSGASENRAAA